MRLNKRIAAFIAVISIAASFAIAEGGQEAKGSEGGQAKGKTIKFLTIWAEDKDNSKLIMDLTKEYQKGHPEFKVDFELVAITDIRQKVKILMASNDLPDAFIYESGKPIIELIDAGVLVDTEKAFKDLGIYDSLEPGAVSLLKSLAMNKGLYDLPLGMNLEGIWYNKKVFADSGVAIPKTWDELLVACEKIKAKGIQPFAQGGKDKWPLTRIVNAYLIRKLGVNAMDKAVAGTASFTDPGYVEAARVVQDMAKKGYFGVGVTTVDYSTAADMLMTGKAAMVYNGSWFVQDLNNAERNAAGPNGIGFFNIPTVAGGVGKIDDYSVNCGNIIAFSKAKWDPAIADWVKFVFTRYGDYAMSTQGALKGYKITKMPEALPSYTKLVAEEMKKVKTSGLWFEARLDDKSSKIAQDNGQGLFVGAITPEDFFKELDLSTKEFAASK